MYSIEVNYLWKKKEFFLGNHLILTSHVKLSIILKNCSILLVLSHKDNLDSILILDKLIKNAYTDTASLIDWCQMFSKLARNMREDNY